MIVNTGTFIGDVIVGSAVTLVVTVAAGFTIWVIRRAWRGE